ncbi:MAG: LysR family transcriptional regulator [Burkholderiaceae bacterium]|jgi:DNA-binding transcriptional LysR family regulator|nr:LysR family transcriptional regulator [Burkholderiaceae bacterium]
MLDPLSLDQLRVFVAIAEKGSFSAAARHLMRAQSAVSGAVANLESALGVVLFDRSSWKPEITPHGHALLVDAMAILSRTEQFKARALGLTQGLESELSLVLDVMYPTASLISLVTSFQQAFPSVALRLCTDVLGGVPERVLHGGYALGVQGLPEIDPELASHVVEEICLVPVASPSHALATQRNISRDLLAEQTQIVLTDNSGRTGVRTISVFSNHRILTSDLGSKRVMLIAGLGWGFMPYSFVEEDLSLARLVELHLEERQQINRRKPLFAIYRRNRPLGPAGRWMLEKLKTTNSF